MDKIHAEHVWWAAIVVWIAVALLWHPRSSPSFTDAPSSSPTPNGFSIFFSMVGEGSSGARRFLGKPSDLPGETSVIVLLSPKGPIEKKDRKEILYWVEARGGTLLLGYPFLGPNATKQEPFLELSGTRLCPMKNLSSKRRAVLSMVLDKGEESSLEIPPFEHVISRVLITESCDGTVLLRDETGAALATIQSYGEGKIVELADADILGNTAIGKKKSHRFAAALIELLGKDGVWAFDESHEGILPRPSYLELLGSTRYRAVFLQLVLLVLLAYWWQTRSLGQRIDYPASDSIHEVTTLAYRTGDLYYRAGKSRFVLDVARETLKSRVKTPGAQESDRQDAEQLLQRAARLLEQEQDDKKKHLYLARQMALLEQKLTKS